MTTIQGWFLHVCSYQLDEYCDGHTTAPGNVKGLIHATDTNVLVSVNATD